MINRSKVSATYRELKSQIVPREDEYHGEEPPGPVYVMAAHFTAIAGTVGRVLLLLPYYVGDESSVRAAIRARPYLYIFHLMVAYLYLTDFGLAAVVFVLVGVASYGLYTGLFGGIKWLGRSAESLVPSETIEVDDDEFVIPADRKIRKSATAPETATFEKDLSTLAVGETRSGKTSAIKMLAAQLSYGSDTAVVAHGSVGEYTDYFGDTLGLQVLPIGKDHAEARWNLFREVRLDADRHEAEERFQEIAATLIPKKQGDKEYFVQGAREVLVALLLLLRDERDNPHHGDLHGLIRADPGDVSEMLADHGHNSAASKVDTDDGDCWGTLTGRLRPMFVGEFAKEGGFSFREYIQNPQGRVVVVESPEVMRSTGAIYAAMLDEAMVRMIETSSTPTYAILDEIDTLEPCNVLSDMAARGLAMNSRMLVGVQTIAQLRNVYGTEQARGIVGNCPQMIGLSPGTADCVEMLQGAIGRSTESIETSSLSYGSGGLLDVSRTKSQQIQEMTQIDESEMLNWGTGEGVIISREHWWMGRLAHPDTAIPELWETRGGLVDGSAATADESAWGDHDGRRRSEATQ